MFPGGGGPIFQFKNGTFVTRADDAKLIRTCFMDDVSLDTHSFRIGGALAAAGLRASNIFRQLC